MAPSGRLLKVPLTGLADVLLIRVSTRSCLNAATVWPGKLHRAPDLDLSEKVPAGRSPGSRRIRRANYNPPTRLSDYEFEATVSTLANCLDCRSPGQPPGESR